MPRNTRAFSYVGILNGGIVFIDEVVLDELDGQGALADTTTADDDKLVPERDSQ